MNQGTERGARWLSCLSRKSCVGSFCLGPGGGGWGLGVVGVLRGQWCHLTKRQAFCCPLVPGKMFRSRVAEFSWLELNNPTWSAAPGCWWAHQHRENEGRPRGRREGERKNGGSADHVGERGIVCITLGRFRRPVFRTGFIHCPSSALKLLIQATSFQRHPATSSNR